METYNMSFTYFNCIWSMSLLQYFVFCFREKKYKKNIYLTCKALTPTYFHLYSYRTQKQTLVVPVIVYTLNYFILMEHHIYYSILDQLLNSSTTLLTTHVV